MIKNNKIGGIHVCGHTILEGSGSTVVDAGSSTWWLFEKIKEFIKSYITDYAKKSDLPTDYAKRGAVITDLDSLVEHIPSYVDNTEIYSEITNALAYDFRKMVVSKGLNLVGITGTESGTETYDFIGFCITSTRDTGSGKHLFCVWKKGTTKYCTFVTNTLSSDPGSVTIYDYNNMLSVASKSVSSFNIALRSIPTDYAKQSDIPSVSSIQSGLAKTSDIPHTLDPQMLVRLLIEEEETVNAVAAGDYWWIKTGKYKTISGSRLSEWVSCFGNNTVYMYGTPADDPDVLVNEDGTQSEAVLESKTIKLPTVDSIPEVPTDYAKQGNDNNVTLTNISSGLDNLSDSLGLDDNEKSLHTKADESKSAIDAMSNTVAKKSDIDNVNVLCHGILHKFENNSLAYNTANIKMSGQVAFSVDVVYIKSVSDGYVAFLHNSVSDSTPFMYAKNNNYVFSSDIKVYYDEACTQEIEGMTVGDFSADKIARQSEVNEAMLMSHGILHSINGSEFATKATLYDGNGNSSPAEILSAYNAEQGVAVAVHFNHVEGVFPGNRIVYAYYDDAESNFVYTDKELTHKLEGVYIKDFVCEPLIKSIDKINASVGNDSAKSLHTKANELTQKVNALQSDIDKIKAKLGIAD